MRKKPQQVQVLAVHGSLYEEVGWEDSEFKASLDHNYLVSKVKGKNVNTVSAMYGKPDWKIL